VFEPASCGVTCFADSISYTVRFATTSVQYPHPKGASWNLCILSANANSALDRVAGPMTDSSSTGLSVQQLLCVLTGASAACGWRKSKGFAGDAR